MALIAIVDVFFDFVSDTLISMFAGCVSMASIIGLAYAVFYLVYKNVKYLCSEDSPEPKKPKVTPTDSVDYIEELISSEEKSPDLHSAPKPSLQDEIFEEQRQTWFLIGPPEDEKIKTLNDLLKHRKTTVASKASHSNFNRDEKIRDFLEHLVASLIRGNLDDVPLTPLSNDIHYDTFFSTYHSKLSSKLAALSASLHSNQNSESLDEKVRPSTLYNELKSTIDEILAEAASLPPLQDFTDDTGIGPASLEICLEKLSYEEILSTAVLNEIISKKQTGKSTSSEWNSRTNSRFTVNLTTEVKENYEDVSPRTKDKFCFTVEERVEEITTKYRVPDDEIEPPLIQHTNNLNVLERHRAQFPELGKDVVDVGYSSYEEDSVTEVVSNVDTWEDNWLFQKTVKRRSENRDRRRKRNGTRGAVSPVSVPMLVPNPSEKFRALIGGVDVDDTSDLSECSDSVIEELTQPDSRENCRSSRTDYMYKYDFGSSLEIPTLKCRVDQDLQHSPSYYYGQNDCDVEQDSSGVTSISRDLSDGGFSFSSHSHSRSRSRSHSCSRSSSHSDDEEPPLWTVDRIDGIMETKNEELFFPQEDSGEGSLETQPENDPHSENGHRNDDDQEVASLAELRITDSNAQTQLNGFNSDPSPDQNLATPPKPGTIAEREHLKWQQATPIPNNPYSKESIEKRNLNNLLPKNSLNGNLLNGSKIDNSEETDFDNNNSEITVTSSSDISGNFLKYERDYYINDKIDKTKTEATNGTENRAVHSDSDEKSPTQNGVAKGLLPLGVNNSSEKRKCNLVRVSSWSERKNPDIEIRKRLPSVKELAKQFSNNTPETTPEVRKYPSAKSAANFSPSNVNKVHSLTARSMSREFREGLKNNVGKTFNRNVLSTYDDDVDKVKNGCYNEKNEENIIRHKSQNGIIIWENQI